MKFKAKTLEGKEVEGELVTNNLGHWIVHEENPHYCSQYGYMEIDGLVKVDPSTLRILIKGKEYDMETVEKLPELIRYVTHDFECEETSKRCQCGLKQLLNQLQ